MASKIFFGGRVIGIPGAYSKIDASSLATVSPASVGIIALIGTAEGGKPLTVDTADSDATRAEKILERYRSGDLRTAGSFAFEPSLDDAIPGGAQRIVAVKVNPATQSAVTLPDAASLASVTVTSLDYGLFTSQVSITVEAGTVQGKKITVTFEDSVEVYDDVGGSAVLTVAYAPGVSGWDAITAQATATQFLAAATRADTGLVAERTADMAGAAVIDYVSSDVGDITQSVTVYGLNGAAAVSETRTLTGTVAVAGTQLFTKVLGARKSAATIGTVLVRRAGPTTLFSLAPATLTRGLYVVTNSPVGGPITVSIDVAAANDVVLVGLSAAGAVVMERSDMTNGLVVPVVGAGTIATLSYIALGDIAGARMITLAANSVAASHSAYNTVTKLVDRLNGLGGFTAVAVISNPSTFLTTGLDNATAVNILSLTGSLYGDNGAFVAALSGSSLVSAAKVVGATAGPANTAGAVFLSGGIEGPVTITQWQEAFTLLKKRRVNIIVPLTRDPAVHALLASHLVFRAGVGRSEANGYIGIGTAGGAGETKANILSQIRALSTRHISAISQEVKRFDVDTGLETFYPPYILAAIAAGMQAGGAIGEPLTHKHPLATDSRQDSSWTVEDDAEEMIDGGLMFVQKSDTDGIRWVRSVTTHLADDNVVFCETSANAAANEAVFRLRTQLERRIGMRGLIGSAAVLKGIANDELGRLIDDEIIVAYRSLQIEQVGDVFPVSVEIAPVLPINFIPITVHLVAVRLAAA